jgi:hypothetical chaperone protein
MTLACGIDFGTSNSSVALSNGATPRLLALQQEATSVPTALFYSFEDGTTTFGKEAAARYLAREEGRHLRAIKSLLGTTLYEEMTQIRNRRMPFSEIVAEFLGFLRSAATKELGRDADEVVIGRPAFFVDDDPAADAKAQSQLEAAARLAGFKTIAFQFEPIAAALDYEQSVGSEEIALVADIGGGTSDFSLVRVGPGLAKKADRRSDILAFNGVHIGGTDFDRLLSMATLMPFLGLNSALKAAGQSAPSWYFVDLATWYRVNFVYDPRVLTEIKSVRRDSAEPDKIDRLIRVIDKRLGHAMLGRIEQAKIDLSGEAIAKLSLADVADKMALRIARRSFEKAITESLGRIEGRVKDLIRAAGIAPSDVRTVFLTGGSSRVPAVRDAIVRGVPDAAVVTGDAFGSVATGLAIDAFRRFGRD